MTTTGPGWRNISFKRSDDLEITCSWSFEKSKARTMTEMLTRAIWLETDKAYPHLKQTYEKTGLEISKATGNIRVGYVTLVQVKVDRNGFISFEHDMQEGLDTIGVGKSTLEAICASCKKSWS